jgi:hypothetical protein
MDGLTGKVHDGPPHDYFGGKPIEELGVRKLTATSARRRVRPSPGSFTAGAFKQLKNPHLAFQHIYLTGQSGNRILQHAGGLKSFESPSLQVVFQWQGNAEWR